MGYMIEQIAHIRTDFPEKFGIPRQPGVVEGLKGKIVFEPEFRNRDCLRGLEEFSHIWLIWQFSKNLDEEGNSRWTPTVRPPRLGGNTRVGVFATRSSFRPNSLGLSVVKIEKILEEPDLGPVIYVTGADMVDGTPIFDIKPYIAYADSIPGAKGGFTDSSEYKVLKVVWNLEEASEGNSDIDCPIIGLNEIQEDVRKSLESILSNDPRPHYHDDPERVYGMSYAGYEVKFKVRDNILYVVEIYRSKE